MKSKFRAKKRFGQNFLNNQDVVDKIINSARLSEKNHVIEIGPGKGVLTKPILNSGASLTAVEIDYDLAKSLKETYQNNEKIKIVSGDILENDWEDLIDPKKENKLVANLAYNITTPFFFKLIPYRKHFKSITLMLQKEVAVRLCNQGGSDFKNYGILSVIAYLCFQQEFICEVPATDFKPAPKVQSAVIKLQPKSQELENENEFFSFVKRAFGHRRKQLGKQLNELEGLCKQKFDVNSWEKLKSLRAENLTPDQFIELFLRGRFLE